MMKIKLNTTLLISGYRDPLPVGAVVEAHDVAEAGQLAALGYVTEVADGTKTTRTAVGKQDDTDDAASEPAGTKQKSKK